MRPIAVLLLPLALIGCGAKPESVAKSEPAPPILAWKPVLGTAPVSDDPDDPAIWIHPTDPAKSLVIGTNKVAAPSGALVVFDLDGKIVQTISGLDRPNNVDLRQGVQLGGQTLDLLAVTERHKGALRFYSVNSVAPPLRELGSARVFEGEMADFAAPMGIAFYKRTSDGGLFAVVGRKSGPAEGYLWQYRVQPGPSLKLVRKFGRFSGKGEIESIAVDDALGYVYYSDEGAGIRKYHADPEKAGAETELALIGTSGYQGDREGLAIYATGDRTGFLVSTDQIEGHSRYLLYRREGTAANPHDHSEVAGVIEGGADSTDGIEVTSMPLGARFPRGLLVTMNSGPKNFLYFAWDTIAERARR